MEDREIRIKFKDFIKESPALLAIFLILPFYLIFRMAPLLYVHWVAYLMLSLLVGFFTISKIWQMNRTVVILNTDSIQFLDPVPGRGFHWREKWVEAKWKSVTKVQSFERAEKKYIFSRPKSEIGWLSNRQKKEDLIMLVTKLWVKSSDGSEDKSLVISISNERYSEYFGFLKTKVEPEKMDSKTIELQNPKVLMDEMIKRKAYL